MILLQNMTVSLMGVAKTTFKSKCHHRSKLLENYFHRVKGIFLGKNILSKEENR